MLIYSQDIMLHITIIYDITYLTSAGHERNIMSLVQALYFTLKITMYNVPSHYQRSLLTGKHYQR
jgi:hypothetical protein